MDIVKLLEKRIPYEEEKHELRMQELEKFRQRQQQEEKQQQQEKEE